MDALLGTGFTGEPRGSVAEAIDAVNAAGAPVVSVDVPSGVDASTGVVCGAAVRAALTVTFHAAKPGLWIHPGKAHAGEVRTLDIGIPRGAPTTADVGLIAASVLTLLPRRGASSTKFSSGHVLVVGGSRGLTGAPRMAAHAAMRAGAGYVTACVPALPAGGARHGWAAGDDDPRPGRRGRLARRRRLGGPCSRPHRAAAARSRSGPASGATPTRSRSPVSSPAEAPVATVIDADGLNAHAGRLRELAEREAPTVLTPHAGELGRLLGLPSEEIERERLRHVRGAAALAGAVVVLKGDDTLIADPSGAGAVAVSPGASPALATAGAGDVLTGVIAALLAQGLPAFAAAAAGVWLHAAAGRAAARAAGRHGGRDRHRRDRRAARRAQRGGVRSS